MPLVLRFCAGSSGQKKLPVPTLALCPLRPTQSSAATCGDDSTSLLPAKRGHTFPSTPARPKRNNPRKFQPGTFLFLGGGESPLALLLGAPLGSDGRNCAGASAVLSVPGVAEYLFSVRLSPRAHD